MNELSIPNEVQIKDDPKATEIVRFWISSGDCHVNLNLGIWTNEGNKVADELWIWSNVLKDIARHVANGLNQRYGADYMESIQKIKDDFNSSMDELTPDLKGE